MGGAQRRDRVLHAGRVAADGVADEGRHPRLVERRPVLDAVVQPVVDRRGVLGEALGRVALGPAAAVLQRLREVPVVERDPRADALGEQRLDQPHVEVQALLVERPAAVGLQARPGEREAVPADPEVGHQGDVLLVAVVVVVGDVARVAVLHLAGGVRERVPDRRLAAVLVDGALDLVARGRGAPGEAVGEADRVCAHAAPVAMATPSGASMRSGAASRAPPATSAATSAVGTPRARIPSSAGSARHGLGSVATS